ncbi:hypothetical protein [Rhizobium sp. WYJ-E13]|uniref:hypothetical protein n=1 Tax=Rhizobium sp. WYJ-E13 TaxID=2849093 RepID=UPI001C1E9ED6|nr:hypothetical protein [Rhizobium sp. WYJ-E13]QWW69987.1 hypothetical protein KQ933_09925 [Rhizobium sp. WYJ-E13]
MHTLTDLLPWILALPPALWEIWRARKAYGWALGGIAGVIVFGGIVLWAEVAIGTAPQLDMRFGLAGAAQALCLLVGPQAVAVWIAPKSSLAAGIFAGVAAGFCLFLLTAVIGLAVHGA